MTRHLPTLSVLHYVYGILTCVGGIAVLALVGMGLFLSSDLAAGEHNDPAPAIVGGVFQGLGWVLFALIEVWGVLIILSGRWIAQRRNRTGSLVVAGLCCLNFPIGMALGIFTLVVLLNDEVQAHYASAQPMVV